MTTTVPTQATQDDLRIVTNPPTMEQAKLLIQILQLDATTGANEGWHIVREFDSPPTMAQLRRKYDPTTAEYRKVMAFLESCEILGTFVKQGVLSEELVNDLIWVAGGWRHAEKLCKSMRKEEGEPRLFENFERLATRASAPGG
jgi:hypothetical protein